MSKYEKLWEHVKNENKDKLTLSFDEIQAILGFPIDHSFLTFKKELLFFGFEAQKISMKENKVYFSKLS